ncbi:MAG: hypothetical protein ACYC2Z_08185 [Candidatus Nanopelagicales bacterium]
MSEHAAKGHPVGAFILLAVICLLAAWGLGLMNGGDIRLGAGGAALLFLFGAYAIVGLGPDGDDA